jgi:hypothetical protein
MKFEIEINYRVDLNIKHLSHILFGLYLLEKKGIVSIVWKHSSLSLPSNGALKITVKKCSTGQIKEIAFDMHDRSDIFDPYSLESSDTYFKRSFNKIHLSHLPEKTRNKIYIYGMNLPMASNSFIFKILSEFSASTLKGISRSPINTYKSIRKNFNYYHQFLGLPTSDEYATLPNPQIPRKIIFQTRLWEQEYVIDDDVSKLNGERVQLIRALKNIFKEQFVGGVIPTEHAQKYYPDCITKHSTQTKDYIRLLQGNLIGIYTRGLNHSIALKMPEYVSASLCIVSEKIENQLSGNFKKNTNYLEFNGVDSCISQCEKLIDNRELSYKMQSANYQYYINDLEPYNKALQCLTKTFSD